MAEVTLNEILASREERVNILRSLLCVHKCPVISFTMNIAGPTKNSPLITRAFNEGVQCLVEKIPTCKILFKETRYPDTGCQMFLAVKEKADVLKEICTNIEETHLLGRIFDIDVTDENGYKLNRKNERGCIVCSAQGRYCASRRVHSAKEVCKVTENIMNTYFLSKDAKACSDIAARSLVKEAKTTPKPGLVDRINNGSHKDMNLCLFLKSADSLKPYFEKCFVLGATNSLLPYPEFFPLLKKAGLEAENAMYNATEGINTHKGIIYSMGIICASMGRLWKVEKPFADTEETLKICSFIAGQSELKRTQRSAKLRHKYGIGGIVEEAKSGFASVVNTGLKTYKELLQKSVDSEYAGAITLLCLIAETDDSNLYHRGGIEGALWAKNEAKKLIQKYDIPPIEKIEKLDYEFIKRNLSPGGCADLLAITYFLYDIEKS